MATARPVDAFRAAARPIALDVRLGSAVYRIPARPAADWMLAITRENALPLLDLVGTDASSRVMVDVIAGRLTLERLADVTRRALAAASGMLWWEADRLIRGSVAQWRYIGGELTRLGVDPEAKSLAAVLNAIYVVAIRSMTQEERTQFDAQLLAPPPDASVQERRTVTASSAAALAAVFGPPPGS